MCTNVLFNGQKLMQTGVLLSYRYITITDDLGPNVLESGGSPETTDDAAAHSFARDVSHSNGSEASPVSLVCHPISLFYHRDTPIPTLMSLA